MASPYNALFVSPTPITGGPTTITKDKDGVTFNSGGKNGTLKTLGHVSALTPDSFTAPTVPIPGSVAAGGKY
jgi:hypothetical protein